MDLNILELTYRTASCLQNAGIDTVQQLLCTPPAKLLTFRNMGKRGLEEVETALIKFGFL